MKSLADHRNLIRKHARADEFDVLNELRKKFEPEADIRHSTVTRATKLVDSIRNDGRPGLMEVFLAEYGLSTDEGVALMCLAEALLRVPDAETIDELIEDKISPSSWGEHLGRSSSSLVNASTWALMLSGKVLKDPEGNGIADLLHGAIKRLGEPVIRVAVQSAMKEMGHQFVLGETIDEAVERGKSSQELGYTYSYDMLGEAALTYEDATNFFHAYCDAIRALSERSNSEDITQNPGISIKLSALHPRYELGQRARVMDELVPRVRELAILAKSADMGLNIDAEEADRLDISLDIIEAVLRSNELEGWDGFGVVVQAFGKRASFVLDWLYALSEELDRKIMVRLVKGAYWDSEIKVAQVDGVEDFPVFTRKAHTDVSYICCAQQLLAMTDRIYPQFATHNAHTIAAILETADDTSSFEFQRLHGMGEPLHDLILKTEDVKARIYAPVGAHRDLLAYLVRRLLENGANSSFVNQIVDKDVPAETVASDPFEQLEAGKNLPPSNVINPQDLFQPERINSKGWDLRNTDDLETFYAVREPFKDHSWVAEPLIAGKLRSSEPHDVINPTDLNDVVGKVSHASAQDVDTALEAATDWQSTSDSDRAYILNLAADLYEQNSGEIFAVLCREAGKSPKDAVAEIREAVDFLRYYAAQATQLGEQKARGIISCISPWNFPLAIFTGQISAALAAGNGVLAKPADPTPLIATIAVKLMHQAGVPKSVLQLLPGPGSVVGAKITSDPRVDGVCFTGSTSVAQTINKAMANSLAPDAMFIAETGGLNAMIVDSTALPEQAVKDIVESAFQSAGQRCSALRVLYLQEDIADEFLDMLYGAMNQLSIGNPWNIETDIGPTISQTAHDEIANYIADAKHAGRLLKQLSVPDAGYFVAPSVIKVGGIADLEKEVFGPVLHVATFKADEIDQVVDDINASGYGLTFGLHTRIDDRVEQVTSRLDVGNIYVNRNQIGAVVGSQPFGGEGMSGTGPKAGGPHYVPKFLHVDLEERASEDGNPVKLEVVQSALDRLAGETRGTLTTADLPGPTGESNRLSTLGRGTILCLGPSFEDAKSQYDIARANGCSALMIVPNASGKNVIEGVLDREMLAHLDNIDGVALWSTKDDLQKTRIALAARKGAIIPLMTSGDMAHACVIERHICIDTTASGGNATLLAGE
ncbi:MAG: bifunctional proline dehydrogenase/L-glutamate gamma-semialdehyde dehydrogenase PutA [Rhizobiaceae bacterium]|nr:bifunctional proline dehydrogenase/L-glutamate gamma-semialdehyde dehydrogenase PutA [Rhizobiaceae bacterium]